MSSYDRIVVVANLDPDVIASLCEAAGKPSRNPLGVAGGLKHYRFEISAHFDAPHPVRLRNHH